MTRARRIRVLLLIVVGLFLLGAAAAAWKPGLAVAVYRRAALWRAGARSGHVTVRGVRMAWAEVGAGRPVVLVHGLGGETLSVLPLARALAARGLRAVAFDLPGFGASAMAPAPLGIDSAGSFVLDAAEALGLGPRPALLGHSLGGWIVAWQALARPERCGPLVLTASAGLPFDPPPLNVMSPRTIEEGRKNVALLFKDPPYLPAPLLWLIVRRPRPANLDLLRSAMSGRFLLDGLLAGMSAPTLLVCGDEDRLVPPETTLRMAREIPGARLLVVRGAGHMLIWEKPEEVAAAVAQFLADNPPPR